MPENRGLYGKFVVQRADGQEIVGRTFTLAIDTDPLALPALKAYRDAAAAARIYPDLVADLDRAIAEIEQRS